MKRTYKIIVRDIATYYIKSDSIEQAEDLACEWFSERVPNVCTEPDPDIDENFVYVIGGE